jgi:hypothetical protein
MSDLTTETNSLAYTLPNGRTFAAKFVDGSNVRRLITGLAKVFVNIDSMLTQLKAQYYPDTTTDFIDEWESAAGIPNAYFKGTGTLAERRLHVTTMLGLNKIATEDDFIALAATLGYTITITHSVTVIDRLLPFSPPYIPSGKTQSPDFVWECNVIGDPVPDFLPLLFDSLKAADTYILYNSIP